MRLLFIIYFICYSYSSAASEKLMTIGWIESVRILPEGVNFKAKIDTGADNSSIGVTKWLSFTRNGKEWVQFSVKSDEGRTKSFERPLERYALIKRKSTGTLKRPVVKMWFCIGNNKILSQVNLAKRSNFKYRILIGRSLLKNNFLVNSATKLTLDPDCK